MMKVPKAKSILRLGYAAFLLLRPPVILTTIGIALVLFAKKTLIAPVVIPLLGSLPIIAVLALSAVFLTLLAALSPSIRQKAFHDKLAHFMEDKPLVYKNDKDCTHIHGHSHAASAPTPPAPASTSAHNAHEVTMPTLSSEESTVEVIEVHQPPLAPKHEAARHEAKPGGSVGKRVSFQEPEHSKVPDEPAGHPVGETYVTPHGHYQTRL